jgi:hypothetical protein
MLLSSAMALLFYSIYVGEAGGIPAHGAAITRQSELGALETALQSAGGRLTEVVIKGWIEVAGSADMERVKESMGWDGSISGSTETRELRIVPGQGRLFLALTWRMNGTALHDWEEGFQSVRSAMQGSGREPYLTVQLAGERKLSNPDRLTETVSAALQGIDPQRWRDERASSVAGLSPLLPPSTMGVNYQVASRRLSDGVVKIWVAWPALDQEY